MGGARFNFLPRLLGRGLHVFPHSVQRFRPFPWGAIIAEQQGDFTCFGIIHVSMRQKTQNIAQILNATEFL